MRLAYEAMHSALEQAMWDAESGAALKKFRVSRGWSQAQLAEEIGCDQSTVSRIENGEAPNRAVHRLIDMLRAKRVNHDQRARA